VAATLRRLLAALALVLAPAVAGAQTWTFSTPIAGDSVPVTVTLANAAGGGVDVTVSIAPGTGDLLGFFGNVVPETIIPSMGVTSAPGVVTQWQFLKNKVSKVGGGNVMTPVGTWDFGLKLGQTGGGGGAVTSATFRLTEAEVDAYEWYRSSREGVLWDLKAYRLILERAQQEGQRFRILHG
jgi:hypothetical protein